jgi:hypothetical protein
VDTVLLIRTAGLLGIVGAFLYAIGDVLLLASKADLKDYPRLQPHARLLSGAEKMVVLPWQRLAWGGLLGVFSTPLVLAGFWHVYQGLTAAGFFVALVPFLLFTVASVVGTFVHGTFIYMGEYVQALNQVGDDAQPVLIDMVKRHRKIMVITYGFLLASILVATIWYAVLVASGGTSFPRWMAAINPVTALAAWMLLKKILPEKITDATEGAGFNIAYLVYFIFTTAVLWQTG